MFPSDNTPTQELNPGVCSNKNDSLEWNPATHNERICDLSEIGPDWKKARAKYSSDTRFGLTKVADLGTHTSDQCGHIRTTCGPKESGQIGVESVLDADITAVSRDIMIYKYNATKLLASELLTALQGAFLSIRLSHPQCLRPTDLTPPTQGLQRSNLMHFAFSQSPVLLIFGPHLSLAKYVDSMLYTIRTLEVSYGACNRLQPPVLPSGNWSYRSLPMGRDAHRLLYKPALATYREQRQQSTVCPQWFTHVRSYLEGHSMKVCGDSDYVNAMNLIIPEKLDPNFLQHHSVRNPSALFQILDLAKDSDFAEQAAIWLRQLSTLDSSVRLSYFPFDAMATVEQLHFTCCRWFHLHSSNSHPDQDIFAPLPPTIPARSSLDQLACRSNWTLQFHTLDSLLHPKLVWELTGHNATVNPTQFSAVIVDQSVSSCSHLPLLIIRHLYWQKAEAVYRLEEPVNYESLSQFISDYHASVLKPWFRHSRSRPSGSNSGHSNRPSFITEIRSRSHLDHLLDERSHIYWTTQTSNTCCAHTSLVLLYYTRACVFASQGESALWHFDVVARQFSTHSGLLFARVDVSAVDLPWHFRAERVPSIIFFPASRSSYSVPFPSASMITHDLSFRLSNFLREHIGLPCVTRTLDVDRASLSSRKHLLSVLQSDLNMIPIEKLSRQLHSMCHNDSSTSPSINRLKACQSGIRAVISDYTTKYKHAQRTASALLRYLQINLNDLNARMVSPFYRMLYATHGQQIHMTSSLMFQSDLWNTVSAFERNVSNLLRLLSVSG
ncbi:uncharacterized protein DEA37_0015115 [Paragonimus westermani]|uniref:Thioredoxin domain-containing protein 11 n=1 Tax=Paragonimus westermani TaxID=34504 RepID=A0A5J4NIL9_9TREM|nr:uncharacterized protein DEA37_0015115 [Paragonimus westermani]